MLDPPAKDPRDPASGAAPVRHGSLAARAFRNALIGTFAAVVLGLLALDVVVIGAVRPQLSELKGIAEDHARAVAVASRLREHIVAARKQVIATMTHPAGVGGAPIGEPVIGGWLGPAGELDRLAVTGTEKGAVEALLQAVAGSERAASAAHVARTEGDEVSARAALVTFLEASSAATDAADRIVLFNAREVQESIEQVRRSLLWLIAVATALTAAVLVGALLLLRSALAGTERYTTIVQHHASEMAAFAGRAAHELRTPLQTLVLSLAAIRRGGAGALDRAEASARRLRETLDGILELSRAGATAAPGRADARRVVTDVLEELAPRAAERGVSLDATVGDDVEIAMTPGHLRTVLANLVGNAIKYTGGRPAARVAVTCAVDGSVARIDVADNGQGISREALPRVFDPFFRASAQPGGYGLGLAIVRRLVDAHHGQIGIASEEGVGTTLTVRLPRAPAATTATHRAEG